MDDKTVFFLERTRKHINLVRKYGTKIYLSSRIKFAELPDIISIHDESKFSKQELEPYKELTWKYKCRNEGIPYKCSKKMERAMKKATEHHITTNKHHPECWCNRTADLINTKDRDKPPTKIIDATEMPTVYIAEMVADWCAVSEERGNSPRDLISCADAFPLFLSRPFNLMPMPMPISRPNGNCANTHTSTR